MMQPHAEDCQERLQKINAEFEEFSYIVSHDLKAPVRAITNLASWIEEDLEGTLPEDSQENFRLLKNRVGRLEKMIQALLEFSRVARLQLETGAVDVKSKIEKLAHEVAENRELKLTISGKIAPLETYAEKLTFVLGELLRNAIFFNSKTQPEIKVELQENAEALQITIADNGPGFPETSLPKLFTMFYTVLPKDQLETTGAGLAIVNKIVNFVGGKITAGNHPEGGAVFTLTWPKKMPSAN
ncbi:sensor histidine kinase [Adhaeribacter soli]|uniref:histidine kinase n=1 Tax=Adhaeribacter soli TaxID=2607655 RepID=A0A5N1JAT5_9BACT|nr:HAMP domain-containing sensor histidine kinase [Adhaeribacter soli]KAA9346128.1 HAMP domain-containing histidine kinase [Adhaeribacter soli]